MERDDRMRKKSWKPKVKTGCITCRIRRVKCDEAKPYCERCTSTGRKCDGYKPATPPSQALVSTRGLPALLIEPTFIGETVGERQSLHFFHLHTAPELAGFFDSTFWLRDVLQASHTHHAIRYAVTALGAMHQMFVGGDLPVVRDDASHKQQRFALEQCNRSIREIVNMSNSISRADKITAMTACILFTCFASLQGHQSSALEHLRSGLKLLKESDTDPDPDPETMAAHPVPMESLRAMFVSLDVQARAMMSDDMQLCWEPRPNFDRNFPPRVFASLKDARIFLEAAFNELICFLQILDINAPEEEEMGAVSAEYQHLIQKFQLSDAALQAFLALPTTQLDQQQQRTVIALRLYRCLADIFVAQFQLQPQLQEMAWDVCEPQFFSIIDLASQMLEASQELSLSPKGSPGSYYQPQSRSHSSSPSPYHQPKSTSYSSSSSSYHQPNSTSRTSSASPYSEPTCTYHASCPNTPRPPPQRPVFSFGFGVVTCLYLVASRSRHPTLRRKAIALLLNYPRREGIWDSVLAGRIAWEVMILEESAVLDFAESRGFEESDGGWKAELKCAADIPDDFRIRDVCITYTGLRSAEVELRSIREWKRGEVGVVRRIQW